MGCITHGLLNKPCTCMSASTMGAGNAEEKVNHPPHYTFGGIEVIDAIEAWGLGFHLGNVVKYIARAEHKGSKEEDLRKAKWYLDRYVRLVGEAN